MAFTKITENDTINKGVIGLPDTPNLSTSEMQAKFEELSNDVIIPKFNNLVDELEAKSAAGNIGATIPSGINAESENVQAVLNGIAEKAHTHEKSDAELTDAVTKAHEHSNKSVIDKFTENESGVPLYNGGKMTGDAFKKVKVGDKYITAEDYDTIEIVAGDNVVIDADTEKKTLKISAIGGSGGGGGDMYKAVYDKDNDGMVDNAKTVGSLDNLNTTNQENVVNAINEVISDRQIKTYLSPTLMDSTKNWTNYELKDLKAGRCLMASLSETTDISNAYTNGVIPVQKAGTLKGINVNNNGFYQYFTIDGEQYINSCSNFVANTFTGWNKFDVDTLTTLEQVTASTDVSKPVGAGAVQELNSSLGMDLRVNNGTPEWSERGADTWIPFSSGGFLLKGMIYQGYYYGSNRKLYEYVTVVLENEKAKSLEFNSLSSTEISIRASNGATWNEGITPNISGNPTSFSNIWTIVNKDTDVSGYKYIAILLSKYAVDNPATTTISF